MAKNSFLEKIAKKSFDSAAFQQSWQIHMQAFGPIMEPAFTDNYQARVHLAAALGRIQNRDIKGGVAKLQEVEKHIETDADKAAWLFFMGLCFEMGGMHDRMIGFYLEAGNYGHKFYLPYLKVAKYAHGDNTFDVAEANYRKGIACLEGKTDAQSIMVLSSTYTNCAACLTMMHRFDDAKAMIEKSKAIMPVQKGRAEAEAILYAALGDRERVAALMEIIRTEAPERMDEIKSVIDEILSGGNTHFTVVKTDAEAIGNFWKWFEEKESSITSLLMGNRHEELFAMMQAELGKLFPFWKAPVEHYFQRTETGWEMGFASGFSASLEKGFSDLIAACPESLKKNWEFVITQ